MKTFIISFLLASLSAHATLTITDKNKLAIVTLHTELIESSLYPEKFHASGIDVKAHLVC